MYRSSFMVRYALLLIVVYAMENQGNSILEDEQNNTVGYYEYQVNFTTENYNENSTRYDEDLVQNKYYNNYTENFYEEENQDTMTEFHKNSTKTDNEGNFIMYQPYPMNNSNENNLSRMYNSTVNFPLCCERDHRMIKGMCAYYVDDCIFPKLHGTNKRINDVFNLVEKSDPCKTIQIKPRLFWIKSSEYIILANGEVYYSSLNYTLNPTTYCFAPLYENKYELLFCISDIIDTTDAMYHFNILLGLIVSLPFMLLTFVVYTILEELRNLHGYILRGYVSCLFIMYTILIIRRYLIIRGIFTLDHVCTILAYSTIFSYTATFFWLNVMCVDIWCNFGELRPLQKSMTPEERKKFIIYSIYAWGCAFIIIIIYAIINSIPNMPKDFIKPEFSGTQCWFKEEKAQWIYYSGPVCVIIFCNICMFISTVLKFMRYKKNTAPYLRGTESRRHNNNKQSVVLYVKLFILMGINWFLEMTSLLFYKHLPSTYIWYTGDMINSLQGLIIFLMFVWTDKVKKLMLKKFYY